MDKITPIFDNPIFINAASVFLLFIVAYTFVKLLQRGTFKIVKDNSSKYRFKKLINFFGYIIFILGIMFIFNTKLSGIGTVLGLGIAGAGIAFALQEVIVSIAGYIAIFTSNFYKVDDRVQLGGIKGDVIDVGMLRTTLHLWRLVIG